ncbi:MAG: radical SAM family heme chaperone HemW [Candidatus Margulisiibacteriota bacterium]|jgi:oxygen-independent coproporphyrinogen-3 oxidase
MNKNNLSIYIHIPFCKKKCAYCNFYRHVWSEEKETAFLKSLSREINCYQEILPKHNITTLFIGGGTPSVLSLAGLKELFTICDHYFDLPHIQEKTIELNPESVTYEKLSLIKSSSINRLSMGVQSMLDSELSTLGRIHSASDVDQAITIFKDLKFTNFNLDYMFGLPNANLETTKNSLSRILAYEPTHLSTYALSIEEQTKFKKQNQAIISQEESLSIFRYIRSFLKNSGFKHYEVSNFAKKEFTCQHNLNYWRNGAYLGFGPSAHSYFEATRFANSADLTGYLKDSQPIIFRKNLKKQRQYDKINDFLICRLRLLSGFTINSINKECGIDFLKDFNVPIKKLRNLKLLKVTSAKIKVTAKGLYLLDDVLTELMV